MEEYKVTSFQEKGVRKCKDFLKEVAGVDVSFEKVMGKSEMYLKGTFQVGKHDVDIYVYTDEAGVMIDSDDWTICEKSDYPSEDHLIEAFITKLEQEIDTLRSH